MQVLGVSSLFPNHKTDFNILKMTTPLFISIGKVYINKPKYLGCLVCFYIHLPGSEVPSATKTTAVTESLRPTVQPKCDAKSPITAVKTPMTLIDTMKHAQPFQYPVGGTQANRIFQKMHNMCMK